MINDWILSPRNNSAYKVDDIIIRSLLIAKDNGKDIDNLFDPIPLTEDILKANGFEFGLSAEQEDFCAMHASCGVSAEKSWVKEDGCASYSISWLDGYVAVSNLKDSRYDGKCKFVHELQHTLRLCGLNELADNFMIKEGGNNDLDLNSKFEYE